MPTGETEIELLARAMIDRHGGEAPQAAIDRLNQMIDHGDWAGRDRWACVVRTIHLSLGVASIYVPPRSRLRRDSRIAHMTSLDTTFRRVDFASTPDI
jgi:hypothetical protein